MKFIESTGNIFTIDDSDHELKLIAEAFGTLLEKKGFDNLSLACGVRPSPDFGYFELANRFWCGAMCIYSLGATKHFRGSGVGYAEPWLFNARHAVELYIKGFFLNAIWFEELQQDPHLPVRKEEISGLKQKLGNLHNLSSLYDDYVKKITEIVKNWNVADIPDVPEIDHLILNSTKQEMINELSQADEKSFRFRYPSIQASPPPNPLDTLQQIGWHHDPSMLFPKTGLPKESGYFFDHLVVINSLYELVADLKTIQSYFESYTQYQDIMNDYWNDYLREFGGDDY